MSERVTYVSIGASPEFDRDFEAALAVARRELPLDVVASIGEPPPLHSRCVRHCAPPAGLGSGREPPRAPMAEGERQ